YRSQRARASSVSPSFPTRRSSDLLGRQGVDERTVEPTARESPRHLARIDAGEDDLDARAQHLGREGRRGDAPEGKHRREARAARSEEHTSELQSRENLVCRLLLEK